MKDSGNKHAPVSESRRGWLLLSARIAAAAALGFTGAMLLRRRCPDGSCPACPEQGGCRKPDAAAFREQIRRRNRNGGQQP